MPLRPHIDAALRSIPDPEMPISIVDLGLVEDVQVLTGEDGNDVHVIMLPTFVGCPALDMIRAEVEQKVGAIEGVRDVQVRWVHDPPWTVDRITEQGRAELREHGVTVPESGSRLDVPGHRGSVELRTSAVPCPFCDSRLTRMESAFGPTRCRMIYYCDACGNSFEHMKRVESTNPQSAESANPQSRIH